MGHLHGVARPARDAMRRCTHESRRARPWGRAAAWLAVPRPVLLRHLRSRELARDAARGCRRRSSSPGSTRSRSCRGRSCPTGRSTSSTACRCSSAPIARELDTHAKRLLTAQVVAIACFLLFPLRFTFERPETGGVFGDLFTRWRPSTSRSTRRRRCTSRCSSFSGRCSRASSAALARVLLDAWFALIGVSVLTT